MAIEARIRELRHRHRDLDKNIEDATRLPAFDDLQLRQMKRQKLRIKEQLEALGGQPH